MMMMMMIANSRLSKMCVQCIRTLHVTKEDFFLKPSIHPVKKVDKSQTTQKM
jgi:hypothetical protein